MESQVLHTVWCNISDKAAGEIWNLSLLGVKGLKGGVWELILQNVALAAQSHFPWPNGLVLKPRCPLDSPTAGSCFVRPARVINKVIQTNSRLRPDALTSMRYHPAQQLGLQVKDSEAVVPVSSGYDHLCIMGNGEKPRADWDVGIERSCDGTAQPAMT